MNIGQRFTAGRDSRRFGRRTMIRIGGYGAGASVLLAACGRSDNGRGREQERVPSDATGNATVPRSGGVLREATITVAPHFSPFHPGSDPSFVNTWRRVFGYYEQLWGFKDVNTTDRLVPRLAVGYEQPDPSTILVTLNDATFHDRPPANGRRVTAEDVVATVQFLSQPPANGGGFLQSGKDLKSVTAMDERTLRFETYGPRAFFFEEMGASVTASKSIVPREMLDEKTLKETPPLGSGPYQYAAHVQGSSEDVRRFDAFRTPDLPYIAERRLTFLPDETAMEVAFRAGQIDVLNSEGLKTGKQKETLVRDLGARIVVETLPSTSGMALMVNVNRQPWSDVRVREAVYRAIDIDRVIGVIYFGDAERSWYFPRARYNRDPLGAGTVQQYVGYDPKKAEDLFKASGIDLDKEYEFMVPVEEQSWVDAARLMGEDLVRAGLKTRITPVVRNLFLQRAGPKPGDFDITMSILLDYQYAHSKSGSFWDSSSLQDPDVDAIVEKIQQTVDIKQRAQLSNDFEMMLARKYSNLIPILSQNLYVAWYAHLQGVNQDFSPVTGYQSGRWLAK